MSELAAMINRPRFRPKPSLRLGKSERTRAAILDAALAFLWTKPFRDMTVNALMAKVPVSRSAFYQYFRDVHELMETLLADLGDEILRVIRPWLEGAGDPVELLEQSLADFVDVCRRQGPFLQALSDAAPMEERLEKAWVDFLEHFDDVVTARIEADREQGLILAVEARPVAVALNRTNAFTVIQAFGRQPGAEPAPVLKALQRIWTTTLYGSVPTQVATRIRPAPDDV
jgi:AcrR family transcriptional regulator